MSRSGRGQQRSCGTFVQSQVQTIHSISIVLRLWHAGIYLGGPRPVDEYEALAASGAKWMGD